MSGSPQKSRPRVSAPKPSANTDLWIIGILFPILVVGGWFGWQVYERVTLQTKLPPKADRGLIDSLAGVFRPAEAIETKTEVPLAVIVPPKPTIEPVVVVPPKVVEEPLPPMALQPYPFTGPDLRDPQRLATLLKDTKARTFDGKWR